MSSSPFLGLLDSSKELGDRPSRQREHCSVASVHRRDERPAKQAPLDIVELAQPVEVGPAGNRVSAAVGAVHQDAWHHADICKLNRRSSRDRSLAHETGVGFSASGTGLPSYAGRTRSTSSP